MNRYEIIVVFTVEAKDGRNARLAATEVLAEGMEGVGQNQDEGDERVTRYRIAGARRLRP